MALALKGREAEQAFLDELHRLNGSAMLDSVATYHVYTDVQPLEEMRPRR